MDQLKKIVIIGAGGLGREVLATLRACNAAWKEWDVLGFLDSDPKLAGSKVGGVPVLGGDDWCHRDKDGSVHYVCAIGNPKVRSRVVEKLSGTRGKFATIVHPEVRVPESVEIGAGTVVMAGTRFTSDAKIGSHVVLYLNCSITHDVSIGEFCMIGPGCNLAGACRLEMGVELGIGVSVLPLRRIGAWAIIGAGSVVIDDIPANSTAVGVPCRMIKQKK